MAALMQPVDSELIPLETVHELHPFIDWILRFAVSPAPPNVQACALLIALNYVLATGSFAAIAQIIHITHTHPLAEVAPEVMVSLDKVSTMLCNAMSVRHLHGPLSTLVWDDI